LLQDGDLTRDPNPPDRVTYQQVVRGWQGFVDEDVLRPAELRAGRVALLRGASDSAAVTQAYQVPRAHVARRLAAALGRWATASARRDAREMTDGRVTPWAVPGIPGVRAVMWTGFQAGTSAVRYSVTFADGAFVYALDVSAVTAVVGDTDVRTAVTRLRERVRGR
jgi:hypothetical protein